MFCFSENPTFQARKQISTVEEKTFENAADFFYKQITRNFCHNIHAKSQERSLTEKRADSKVQQHVQKLNQNNFSVMEVYILKQ